MSIAFYFAPMSSATPVACALAELDVPHEPVRLDFAAGDTRKPEFLALNPNGKVPTLVVDGTPRYEALAIMLWLGDRYGVAKGLWPAADAPARCQAMAWSTWAYVTFGGTLNRLFYATSDRLGSEFRHQPHAGLQDLGAALPPARAGGRGVRIAVLRQGPEKLPPGLVVRRLGALLNRRLLAGQGEGRVGRVVAVAAGDPPAVVPAAGEGDGIAALPGVDEGARGRVLHAYRVVVKVAAQPRRLRPPKRGARAGTACPRP